jgi:hypothetical protein
LHGREAKLPLEFALSGYKNEEPFETAKDPLLCQVELLSTKLKQVQEQAQQKITLAQTLYKQKYDQKRKVPEVPRFKIDDQVLRAQYELGTAKKNKLESQFQGPYYIHQAHQNGTYKLRKTDGQKLQKLIHGNHLKLYHPPPKPQPFIEILQWNP